MTTAYTPILKLALPVTGELVGNWGDVVNDSITSMLEEAVAGLATIDTWVGASHTLTTADGATSESRAAILSCSGTPGGAATVICPTATKVYVLRNGVGGGYGVTLKTAAGTGIEVANGTAEILYCDGTNVVRAASVAAALRGGAAGQIPYQSAANVTAFLAAGSSGQSLLSGGAGAPTWGTPALATAATSATTSTNIAGGTANSIPYQTGAGATTFLAPGTSGYVLATNGAGSAPTWRAPSDVTVYPGAGIAVSTGSAWGTSKASPSGDIVGTTDTQTLSNKTLGDCTVDGTNTVGFRNIPQQSQSGDYTLVLTDAGKHVYHPASSGTGDDYTIPANSSVPFPIGTAVTFINDFSSGGSVGIKINTDTLVLSPTGSTGNRTLAAGGMATAIKVTATQWMISGTGLS